MKKIGPIISKLKHKLDLNTNIPTWTPSFSNIKYSMSRKDRIYIHLSKIRGSIH